MWPAFADHLRTGHALLLAALDVADDPVPVTIARLHRVRALADELVPEWLCRACVLDLLVILAAVGADVAHPDQRTAAIRREQRTVLGLAAST